MNYNLTKFLAIILLLSGLAGCNNKSDLQIIKEVTGPIGTNAYLIIDNNKAALVDPGDRIDSLANIIDAKKLELKYILITHSHPDHIAGIVKMNLKERFAGVKICMSKEEYKNMTEVQAKWKETYSEELVNEIMMSPIYLELFSLDYSKIGIPDIFTSENKALRLDNYEIEPIKTPGHSPGSISYYIGNYLFSGDELIFEAVGGTSTLAQSSFENQVISIRRLYNSLPDETIVLPGHRESTTIGHEKIHNKNITPELAQQ